MQKKYEKMLERKERDVEFFKEENSKVLGDIEQLNEKLVVLKQERETKLLPM